MRGMKSEDLEAIVDFLYCGEANVFQENLDSFLAIAEELQLKGLMGQDKGDGSKEKEKILSRRSEPTFKRESKNTTSVGFLKPMEDDQIPLNEYDKANRSVALTSMFSGELQELDEQVKGMLEKTHNVTANGKRLMYVCKACGKEGDNSMNMKRHIESNHLEGVSIPCNLCEKTARSRQAIIMHKRSYHADH